MSSPFSGALSGGTDVNLDGLTPVAEFRSKKAAHAAVEYLSSQGIKVRGVTLVGEGVRVIEQVMGPIPYGRVALRGAMSGAWMGLFVGILLSVTRENSPVSWSGSMLIGVAIGMLVAVVTFALGNRKKRALSISHQIVPERFVMCCPTEELNAIRQSLAELQDIPLRMIGGAGSSRHLSGGSAHESVTHSGAANLPGAHQLPNPNQHHVPNQQPDQQTHPHQGQQVMGAPGATPPAGGTPSPSTQPGSDVQPSSHAQPAPAEVDVATGLTYGEAVELKRRQERERQQSQGQ